MLTLEERGELEEMSRSRTLPAGDVFRARLILLLAEGLPYRTIEEKLATTAPTIARWRARFEEGRVAGLLEVRHPGQQPTVITPALQAKVLSATRKKPSDGSTHWSCRKLAKHLHISKDASAVLDPDGPELGWPTSRPRRIWRRVAEAASTAR